MIAAVTGLFLVFIVATQSLSEPPVANVDVTSQEEVKI